MNEKNQSEDGSQNDELKWVDAKTNLFMKNHILQRQSLPALPSNKVNILSGLRNDNSKKQLFDLKSLEKGNKIKERTQSLEAFHEMPVGPIRDKRYAQNQQNTYKNVFPAYGVHYEGNDRISQSTNNNRSLLGSRHKRRQSLKVKKDLTSAYEGILGQNWKITQDDPTGTLFDNKYKQRVGKQNFRNSDIITIDGNANKVFNDQVL